MSEYFDAADHVLLSTLEMLELQAVYEIAPDWVGIPTVEWEAIMWHNAEITGCALLRSPR